MAEIEVVFGGNLLTKYTFNRGDMVIGRTRDNDIVVDNLAVSRKHARLTKEGDDFFVADLNSGNGTFVNGSRITKAQLNHGDEILIGKHKLVFKNLMTDAALSSDIFGAERTKLVGTVRVGSLVVTRGAEVDREYRIRKAKMTVGRGDDCDIKLPDKRISKCQATVFRKGDSYLLRNEGTWRRTKINGREVGEVPLKQGDQIEMGNTCLMFCLTEEETMPGSDGGPG